MDIDVTGGDTMVECTYEISGGNTMTYSSGSNSITMTVTSFSDSTFTVSVTASEGAFEEIPTGTTITFTKQAS